MNWNASVATAVAACAMTLACFNDPQHNTIVADNRFEAATASVVLGARQLLVDTSNGDVWVLEGDRAPAARWVLLTRGPDDAREAAPPKPPEPTESLELEPSDA